MGPELSAGGTQGSRCASGALLRDCHRLHAREGLGVSSVFIFILVSFLTELLIPHFNLFLVAILSFPVQVSSLVVVCSAARTAAAHTARRPERQPERQQWHQRAERARPKRVWSAYGQSAHGRSAQGWSAYGRADFRTTAVESSAGSRKVREWVERVQVWSARVDGARTARAEA